MRPPGRHVMISGSLLPCPPLDPRQLQTYQQQQSKVGEPRGQRQAWQAHSSTAETLTPLSTSGIAHTQMRIATYVVAASALLSGVYAGLEDVKVGYHRASEQFQFGSNETAQPTLTSSTRTTCTSSLHHRPLSSSPVTTSTLPSLARTAWSPSSPPGVGTARTSLPSGRSWARTTQMKRV